MKKYLVVTNPIRSKNDGEEHFIRALHLCYFYGVDRADCVFAVNGDLSSFDGYDLSELIILTPRSDGDYTLPEHPNKDGDPPFSLCNFCGKLVQAKPRFDFCSTKCLDDHETKFLKFFQII